MHVRGVGKNSLALRLRLTSLLSTADFRPEGAPPSSIIVVRRIIDPMPGQVSAGRVNVSRSWERAVRRQLGAWYRTAARPSRGVIPPGADAVVFADESEMMACLTLDLARGDAVGRWWWQAVLRRLPAGSRAERIGAVLRENARSAPAMLQRLTDWSSVTPVLESLTEEGAVRVLEAICEAFNVASLSDIVAQPREANLLESERPRPRDHDAADGHPPRRGWPERNLFQSIPADLGPARRGLIFVALTLQQSPRLVRSPEFGRALRMWMAADAFHTSGENVSSTVSRLPQGSGQGRPNAATVPLTISPADAQIEPVSNGRPRTGLDLAAGVRGARVRAHPAERKSAKEHADVRLSHGDERLPSTPKDAKQSATTDLPASPDFSEAPDRATDRPPGTLNAPYPGSIAGPASDRPAAVDERVRKDGAPSTPFRPELDESVDKSGGSAEVDEQTDSESDPVICTRLGGVFYLLNLMMYLDLPACFETSWRLESKLGAWGMLDVLARALLQADQDRLAGDPLWECLAVLDGRSAASLPGTNVSESPRYVIPPKWSVAYEPLSASYGHWAARGGRFRVWSDDGYVMADIPCTGPVSAEKSREMIMELGFRTRKPSRRAFHEAPVDDLSGLLLEGLNPSLLRWAALVVPYLRVRLCAALELNPTDPTQLAERMLLQEARLYLTSSHVDLVVPIESVSLAVRRAGLDRDPGWWPLLGRVVYFHFE